MDKRQDAHFLLSTTAWLTLSLLFLMGLAACHTDIYAPPIEINQPTDALSVNTPTESQPALTTPSPQAPNPTPTADCLQGGGQIQTGLLYSEHLEDSFHYQVYLPPCYHAKPDQHYPVVYLLHGLSFTEDQWIRLGVADQMDRLIADGIISPFIIIMPGEARSQPPQTSPFAEALVQELVPWVDQQYRTRPEKPFRAIGGLSRGAAWAVHIGFEHYQHFTSVGAHSLPLFAADGGRLNSWLAQIPDEDLPCFFIDIGRGDQERLSAQTFADQLNENNVPHTWYLFNGNHTEVYWSAYLETYLRWYARNW